MELLNVNQHGEEETYVFILLYVTVYISKNDMDVNEHERLSNITLRHTLM